MERTPPTLATAILAAVAVAGCSTSHNNTRPQAPPAMKTSPHSRSASVSPSSTPILSPSTTTRPTVPAAPISVPAPQPIDASIAVYADCVLPAAQQKPAVEPTEIVMACADDGFGIEKLQWSSWTAADAQGMGTTWYKDCKPDCASGKIVYTPGVHVTLTSPVRGANGGQVWSRISFSSLPPGYPPGAEALSTGPH